MATRNVQTDIEKQKLSGEHRRIETCILETFNWMAINLPGSLTKEQLSRLPIIQNKAPLKLAPKRTGAFDPLSLENLLMEGSGFEAMDLDEQDKKGAKKTISKPVALKPSISNSKKPVNALPVNSNKSPAVASPTKKQTKNQTNTNKSTEQEPKNVNQPSEATIGEGKGTDISKQNGLFSPSNTRKQLIEKSNKPPRLDHIETKDSPNAKNGPTHPPNKSSFKPSNQTSSEVASSSLDKQKAEHSPNHKEKDTIHKTEPKNKTIKTMDFEPGNYSNLKMPSSEPHVTQIEQYVQDYGNPEDNYANYAQFVAQLSQPSKKQNNAQRRVSSMNTGTTNPVPFDQTSVIMLASGLPVSVLNPGHQNNYGYTQDMQNYYLAQAQYAQQLHQQYPPEYQQFLQQQQQQQQMQMQYPSGAQRSRLKK